MAGVIVTLITGVSATGPAVGSIRCPTSAVGAAAGTAVPSVATGRVGLTPGAGTTVDGDAVATEVGGTEVAVACVVGEGAAVIITVRVGSGPVQPKASPIRDRSTIPRGKHRLAFNNLLT